MARNFTAASSEIIQFSNLPLRMPTDWPMTIYSRAITPNSTEQTIFGFHGTAFGDSFELAKRARTTGIRYQLAVGGTKLNGGSTFAFDIWHSVIGVIRSDADREIYVNGVSDGTSVVSKTFPSILSVNIGASGIATPNRYYDGDIQRCAAWSAELLESERLALDAGADPRRIRPNSLVFFCEVDGRSNPERDLVDTGNLGTVTGTKIAPPPPTLKPLLTPRKFRYEFTPTDAAPPVTNTKRSFVPMVIG